MKYNKSISECIGDTPLLKIGDTKIFAKLEFLNPGGSIKDRLVRYIMDKYSEDGTLNSDSVIVENSSGNTGAAISMLSAAYGCKSTITIPDKMSNEKISRMRAYGSNVHVTPTDVDATDPRSYYSLARSIANADPKAIYPDQYNNPLNAEAHYSDTAVELWTQSDGEIDIFICGIGTGGTISGVGRYLKEQNPDVKVIGVDPVGSIFYNYFYHKEMIDPCLYKLEGIGEDYLVDAIDFGVIDEIEQVTDQESFLAARELAKNEGVLCGGSSGSAYCVAKRYNEEHPDKNIVMILPDSGNMYLSKFLNDDWMDSQGFDVSSSRSKHKNHVKLNGGDTNSEQTS